MSSTIEHVESSDDLELLEAEVETARARREEREAIERLARARRARSSATSACSKRSAASTISSAKFEAVVGQSGRTYRSSPYPVSGPGEQSCSGTRAELSGPGRGSGVGERAPVPVTGAGSLLPAESPPPRAADPSPTTTSSKAPAPQPELPTKRTGWLPAFVTPFSVRDRVAEIEQGRTQDGGSDDGGGVMRMLEERVHELEQRLVRPESRASFESVVSAPPPGLSPTPDPVVHAQSVRIGFGVLPPASIANMYSEDEDEFTHVDDAWHAWHANATEERTASGPGEQSRAPMGPGPCLAAGPGERLPTPMGPGPPPASGPGLLPASGPGETLRELSGPGQGIASGPGRGSAWGPREQERALSGPGRGLASGPRESMRALMGPGREPGVGRLAPVPMSGAGSRPPAENPPSRVPDAPPPPPSPPGNGSDDDTESSDIDDQAGATQRRKRKAPYKVKNAEMRLPPYPSMPAFQSWRRHVRTAAISACERPERARDFIFSVEHEGATFESLAINDADRHRALDAKLADALLKIVKGDLARRLAVMSERLAMNGRVLAGRQILFLIYKEFAKDSHQTDCQAYTHLEKMQGIKDIKGLETFLTVWDNLMQSFRTPPKPDHLYTAFLSKIRNIPELAEPIKKLNRLPWDDPKKTYESLREECDFVIEEARQEKMNLQLEKLYESGNVATALAATPEEKAKLPCFFVRDGKTCPNGKNCPYSHQKDVIEKAKKAKEAKQAGKGKEGDKGKDKGGKDKGKDKDKKGGKGKGKGKICPYFNDKGCNFGSACKMLHEAPAMAASQASASPAPKAKAAAAPKGAAADQAKA